MRDHPALDINWIDGSDPRDEDRTDRLMAELDVHQPTAVEDTPAGLRVFFADAAARDAALATAARSGARVTSIDVPDEDWAARSQAALEPVIVGDVIVAPPWHEATTRASGARHVVIIQPSMGFGTGHHATTRLCLRWLQRVPVSGARVIDVGTGSGVLAIAAVTLGARNAIGVDVDPDALSAAEENVARNDTGRRIELRETSLEAAASTGDRFDIVIANLTGALLARSADQLRALAGPSGLLIASGFQTHEADEVIAALQSAGWQFDSALDEQDWVGAVYRAATQRS